MKNIIFEIGKVIESVKFKPSDAEIYSILLEKGGMTVSEIAKELDLSVRFVRDRLKRLYNQGIVTRELIKKGWIGYLYKAENPVKVFKKLKSKIIEEFENLEKQLFE
ncbi:MAG TPA: transcriptional regulator [Archaeoglobaceae archaeon]|nr:transcriptional regulator [Archaeoglobaceae archaeon]